jgi:hypothetical protein
MSARQIAYGLLAVLAVIGGWYYNIQYYLQAGDEFGWIDWMQRCFVNPAAASAFMDLTFAYIITSMFMIIEARRIGMRAGWVYVVVAIWISLGFAIGLFLLMRERHFRKLGAAAA